MQRKFFTAFLGFLALAAASFASLAGAAPKTDPADKPAPAKGRIYRLGGKPHPAKPEHLLTDAKWKAVLNTPVSNPHLAKRRAAHLGAQTKPSVHDSHRPGAAGAAPADGTSLANNYPESVDWRNRWSCNWITPVQDQADSENCWAFSSNALVEAMVRVEHGVWSLRSVVELRKGVRKKISDGGNPGEALDWAHNHGLADPDCSPFTTDDKPLTSSPDRDGRTVKVPAAVRVPNDGNMASVKRWLDAVGPVVTFVNVYTDFDSLKTQVYRKMQGVKLRGGHFVLVVGYDDDQQCWICKNSSGTSWGHKGFCRIGYG